MALQRKTQMKSLLLDKDTTKEIELGRILEQLNQRRNRRRHVRSSDMNVAECENENYVSTQFLSKQKIN